MKAHWLSVPLLTIVFPSICLSAQTLFTDVSDYHPYRQAIEWAKQTGVLQGYPDGTFKPDKSVNRAEFLKIILEAKGSVEATTNVSGFSDVDENAWYASYIRYAKEQGIIQGYADGTFRPEQAVNFAEALKMAYVALNVETENVAGEWYDRYLNHARLNSVLYSSGVDMGSDMQRKDVVWIVWRLLNPTIEVTPKEPEEDNLERGTEDVVNHHLFPINLLNNPEWEIIILGEEQAFRVTRKDESMDVVAFDIDLKLGKTIESSASFDYDASFERQYIEPHADVLNLKDCFFRYEYIKEDLICSFIRIPVQIESSNVKGDDSFEFLVKQMNDDFVVNILSKSSKEISCNVKGETHEGQKVYYTQESEFFADTKSGFKCFATESDARRAGYKPSFK